MKPGDATANGEYNVTSDTFETSANLTTTYEEALVGNMVAGFVTTVDSVKGFIPVANAEVSIKGGQTVKTNENGYYQIAATNGKKTVTAKKAGFVTDTKVQAVDINRNHVTSQNFVLEQFNIANVYAEIEVKDDKDTAVTGADVKLYDGSKLIGNLTTNAQGKVLFANYSATTKFTSLGTAYTNNATVTSPDKTKAGLLGTSTQGLLETGKTYTIKVQKQISKSNLKDVHTIKTATFTVDNEYEHNVKVTSPTVKKINSFVVTNKFTDDAQKLISDVTKAEVKYELYTTVNNKENGEDATTAQKLADNNTTAFAGATDTNVAKLLFSNNKKDSATTELVGASDLLPADATLPTGDYYLVVKVDDDKDSANESALSYVAVKISVTEGQKATATATIDTGYTRRLNSVIGLAKDEAGVNTGASSSNLTNIQRGTTGAYETGTDEVKAKHIVYQVMADKVKIPVIDGTAAVVPANAKGTYSFEGTYKNFYPTADYEFTTQGDYILTKSDNQNIKNIVNTDLNMETLGAWNIVGGTINVTGDLIGKTVSSDTPKLTKVTVKDSTGKVVAEKTVDIALTATAVGTEFAEGDKLTFTTGVPTLNLPAGQYTVEYTLNGYLPISTSLTSMAGLEKVSPATTANLVKDPYSEKAGVKGKITVKGDDGKYYTGSELETAVKDGVATLINADGKIAGIGKIDAKGEYSVLDADATYSNKITAGVYTLAIRFKTPADPKKKVENKIIKNVVIENNKQTEKNVETVQGGLGSVKATVQSDTYVAIPTLSATAYDEAYAKETVTGVNITGIADEELLGKYDVSTSINGTKTVEFANLSAGKYTIDFTNTSGFATGKENIVVQDVNQKLYPTYTYKYNGSGSNLVDINVNVKNTANDALVVVAKDKDGKIVNDGTLVKAIGYTNAAKTGSSDFVTVKVPSGATYTVEVYTMSGNQVASKVVNVQTVATTIDMSTYDLASND